MVRLCRFPHCFGTVWPLPGKPFLFRCDKCGEVSGERAGVSSPPFIELVLRGKKEKNEQHNA